MATNDRDTFIVAGSTGSVFEESLSRSYISELQTDFSTSTMSYIRVPFSQCGYYCDNSVNCIGFTLHKDTGQGCWLRSALANRISTSIRDTYILSSVAYPPSSPSRRYTKFIASDCIGADISSVSFNVTSCMTVCDNSIGCSGFSINSDLSALKYRDVKTYPMIPNIGSSLSISYFKGDFSACSAACQSTAGCIAFSPDYVTGKNCWLRGSLQSLSSNSSSDTFIESSLFGDYVRMMEVSYINMTSPKTRITFRVRGTNGTEVISVGWRGQIGHRYWSLYNVTLNTYWRRFNIDVPQGISISNFTFSYLNSNPGSGVILDSTSIEVNDISVPRAFNWIGGPVYDHYVKSGDWANAGLVIGEFWNISGDYVISVSSNMDSLLNCDQENGITKICVSLKSKTTLNYPNLVQLRVVQSDGQTKVFTPGWVLNSATEQIVFSVPSNISLSTLQILPLLQEQNDNLVWLDSKSVKVNGTVIAPECSSCDLPIGNLLEFSIN